MKDSTEYHAFYRDTVFLVHVHFGWASEPVKWDLKKLLPGQANFSGFDTHPDNKHWHAFSPLLLDVFHGYIQPFLTQTHLLIPNVI